MGNDSNLYAGGGPENVLLVVNPKSEASLCVANYYIKWRQIPPGNVLYLAWPPQYDTLPIDSFRREILGPILKAIEGRRLGSQIDYIIYSTDFPWGVDLSSDIDKFKEQVMPFPQPDDLTNMVSFWSEKGLSKIITPKGSINGLTFFHESVMSGKPDYLDLTGNHYLRTGTDQQKDKISLGFRSSMQFDTDGSVVQKGGNRYYLSAMLGVTAGRGNSVEEILNYLHRSTEADGRQPLGTIYFVKNEDVRSKVRHDFYPNSVKILEALHVKAEILPGTVPLDKKDVMGVMMGTANFNWGGSGSKILPGAICEHFTSYGGVLTEGVEQTPLSEFLKYGAAGSSGTVTEPYALINKFPNPLLQVHYVRGCSLLESFYQSVFGPYQLLIVGDPLCQPWADIPLVEVAELKPAQTLQGKISLTPSARYKTSRGADHFELFINGSRAARCDAGASLNFDTTALPDGYQEFRVVAVQSGNIACQGRIIIPVYTNNYGRKIDAQLIGPLKVPMGEKVKIEVNSPDSIGICALHNGRIVQRIQGDTGTLEIPTSLLGLGPAMIQVVGLGAKDVRSHVVALPIQVLVDGDMPKKAPKKEKEGDKK